MAALTCLPGCSFLNNLLKPSAADTAKRGSGHASCGEVLYPLEGDKGDGSSPLTTEHRKLVLLASCRRATKLDPYGREIEQQTRYDSPHYLFAHGGFDDRRNDPLEAALLLVECDMPGLLGGTKCAAFSSNKFSKSASFLSRRNAAVGMLFSYAVSLDRDAVQGALNNLSLDPEIAQVFLARLDTAIANARAEVERMAKAKREIVAGIPVDVRSERRAYFSRHAALYAELDAIVPKLEQQRQSKGVEPETLTALTELRSRYAEACPGVDCRFDPFYVAATRELALGYLAMDSALGAAAEARLLRDGRAQSISMAQTILGKQLQAVNEAEEARHKRDEAKDKGLDEAGITALLGGVTPLDVDYKALWVTDSVVMNYADLIEGKRVHEVESIVKSVTNKGGKAKISFRGSSFKTQEAYACRDTRRVERIRPDGTLEYGSVCKYRTVTVKIPPKNSVTVPANEATAIKPGELVSTLTSGEEALVVSVGAGDKFDLVQWRGDRFAPLEPRAQ